MAHDVASTVSSINEVVSVSSSIYANDLNVKYFSNITSGSTTSLGGYWQTVYDASPTGSTSTALFDMTFGYSADSAYNISTTAASSQNEKVKIYRQMASALLGDPDSHFVMRSSNIKECFFIMVKRNIQKDELKKGSVSMLYNLATGSRSASDDGAVTEFKQTVGGDYAPLYRDDDVEIGQVWYQAGVFVLDATNMWDYTTPWSGSDILGATITDSQIDWAVKGLRTHLTKINLHNQTNLYSTIYFCRATNTEFNYSSNPTFVDDNKRIIVTSGSNILQTRTYVTTIGLYDTTDNLLAVAKVNKPITKSPDTEATFRIRLDF